MLSSLHLIVSTPSSHCVPLKAFGVFDKKERHKVLQLQPDGRLHKKSVWSEMLYRIASYLYVKVSKVHLHQCYIQ